MDIYLYNGSLKYSSVTTPSPIGLLSLSAPRPTKDELQKQAPLLLRHGQAIRDQLASIHHCEG